MSVNDLDLIEKPLTDLLQRIEELQQSGEEGDTLEKLRRELDAKRREIYGRLTPWQTALVARHPRRPYTLDFVSLLMEDFVELAGDRRFADDRAIVAGFAKFEGRVVAVIGHQKGRDTKAKLERNFGMPRPEGYRKALRVMKMAEKFSRPVLTFIDTPGAYPGLDAEERGQAEAIAVNLREMARLKVPIIATVTGEGGSGGALALGVADRVLILEHGIYSVISPEGCAAILWKDASRAPDAAEALRITSQDLLKLGVVDEIVPEPPGGAHQDPAAAARNLREPLARALQEVVASADRVQGRYQKFRRLGVLAE